MKIKDCYKQLTPDVDLVAQDDDLKTIIEKIRKNPISRSIYVVDTDKKLVGNIYMRDIIRVIGLQYLQEDAFILVKAARELTAGDLMRRPVSVSLTDTIDDALKIAVRNEYNDLPVVDENKCVIGELNCFEMLDNVKI